VSDELELTPAEKRRILKIWLKARAAAFRDRLPDYRRADEYTAEEKCQAFDRLHAQAVETYTAKCRGASDDELADLRMSAHEELLELLEPADDEGATAFWKAWRNWG